MVRKRYQKVTREYCNQAIDLLIAYFIKLLSVRRVIRQVLSDTYLDRLHRSSLTDFTAYYSIAYTLHRNTSDLSNLVRILRVYKRPMMPGTQYKLTVWP